MSDFKVFLKAKSKEVVSRDAVLDKLSQDVESIIVNSGAMKTLGAKIISTVSGFSQPNKAERKFSENVVVLANSDEVLTDLSAVIGKPEKTETEEEFVVRSKAALRTILRRKLEK